MDQSKAEAIKTLTKARNLIRRGWIKGDEHVAKGGSLYVDAKEEYITLKVDSYCAYGAIRRADGPGEKLATITLINAVRSLMGKQPLKRASVKDKGQIFSYNDDDVRTKKEVLNAFDVAIKMIDVDEEAASNGS